MTELHKRSLSQSHLSARIIKVQDKADSTEKLDPQSSDNCIYSLVKKTSDYSLRKHLKSCSSNGFRANVALSCDFEELEEENENKLLNMSSEDIVLSNSLMYTPSTTPLSSHNKSVFNYSPENTSSSSEQTPKLIRAKAKEYRKKRGKNLFSKFDESYSNEITASSSNTDICLPPTPLSEPDNINIQKLIKIQAVIRRHLTMKKIRENEEYRTRYRTALQNNLEYDYRQEIKKIEKLLKNGLKCKEYDDAVEQVKDYVSDVMKDPMDVNDYKTKVQYLFSLCDENQQGCLEEEQFLVLTEEIMKLSVPKSSYEHLFNKDNHIYCDFERFYRWFNRIYICNIYILKYRSERKRSKV